jgi:toluene monooxygenase system protein B
MSETTEPPTELGVEDRAPELVPLNAIFSNDFVEILVPVTTADTMDEVAAAVAYHSEGRRVRKLPHPKVVIHDGRTLPGHMTVAEAGITALDHVSVEYDTSRTLEETP